MRSVEVKAKGFPGWEGYARFCGDLQRGLRKQAFEALEGFIAKLELAPLIERCQFVHWLLSEIDQAGSNTLLAPHPLKVRIVDPTLLEWVTTAPNSSEPHRWIGGHDHLKRAIEIDPDDQIARKQLVVSILDGVAYATHEMPRGYLGSPQDDWQALAEAELLLAGLTNEEIRRDLLSEVAEQRLLVEAAWEQAKRRL
jgi:hypothetical protein